MLRHIAPAGTRSKAERRHGIAFASLDEPPLLPVREY
jgi:hypothetical protein